MGAWIETAMWRRKREGSLSLPSWERGLKLAGVVSILTSIAVAPLVGAWIETFVTTIILVSLISSLPSWERGLKPSDKVYGSLGLQSLPSWERGLKHVKFSLQVTLL